LVRGGLGWGKKFTTPARIAIYAYIYGGTDSHYLIIRQVAEKSKGRAQKRLMPNAQYPIFVTIQVNLEKFRDRSL